MQVLWIRWKMQAYFHLKKKYMEQNLCLQALLLSLATLTSLTSALQQAWVTQKKLMPLSHVYEKRVEFTLKEKGLGIISHLSLQKTL